MPATIQDPVGAPAPLRESLRLRAPSEQTAQLFGMVPAGPWADTKLSLRAKAILGGLAILALGRREGVWASHIQVAAACGCDVRTARKGLAELATAGVIEHEELDGHFRFLFRVKARAADADREQTARKVRAQCAPTVRAMCSPPPDPPIEDLREREKDRERETDARTAMDEGTTGAKVAETIPVPLPVGPKAAPREPDERATLREGEEHKLFLEAWRELIRHEDTAYLAREIVQAVDTPGIACLASWRLWVASRVALLPDKSKDYRPFLGYAQRATPEEYHRLRDAEVRGAAEARGIPPRPAQRATQYGRPRQPEPATNMPIGKYNMPPEEQLAKHREAAEASLEKWGRSPEEYLKKMKEQGRELWR